MKEPSNYPPGVTGNEPEIQGYDYPAEAYEEPVTLRDFFMANAPEVPEWWPSPKVKTIVTIEPECFKDHKVREMYHGWNDYLDDSDIPPELLPKFQAYLAIYKKDCEARAEQAIAVQLDRVIAWQMAYADAAMKARK